MRRERVRSAVMLGAMALASLSAQAARRVTVAQLEETLAASLAEHHSDAEVARQVSELELTERLTTATLDRLAHRLPLEPRTALAVKLAADQAAFLDPPAGELPATALPDAAAWEEMIARARGYVLETLARLPDFFATRTTVRFDDTPQVLKPGDWPVRAGLHVAGTVSRRITFRDGKEVADAAPDAASANAAEELGLHTWGEFGPELAIVLTDAAKGKIDFEHWEQGAGGLVAVYRYAVPRAASHYAVQYCCVREFHTGSAVAYGQRGRGGGGRSQYERDVTLTPYRETPGYHGTLAVDPVTGAPMRITLEAELSGGDPLLRAATVVEYGAVKIGERSYICPVESLAVSMVESAPGGAAGQSPGQAQAVQAPMVRINETSFTKYQRLGAEVRMMAAGEAAAEGGATAAAAPVAAGATAAAEGSAATKTEAPGTAAALAEPMPPAAVPPPAPPANPEISLAAANGLPDQPAMAGPASEGGFSLKMTARLVDVSVMAFDKKGHAVRDLEPGDFEIYDNGKRQEIRNFAMAATEPAPAEAQAAEAATFTNRAAGQGRSAPVAAAGPAVGATVLLLDDGHIAWNDLAHARQEILKFLETLPKGERVGLYVIGRTGFRVLAEIATGHDLLTETLKKWAPTAQAMSQANDEEMRNRQQFNEVHSATDLNSVNGNQVETPDAQTTTDPLLRQMGSDPARESLQVLVGVARHLAAAPGHKNLIWVSSDNVFADWRNQAVGIEKSPKQTESFAQQVQEAMNEAHVAVYPFDVSQLEAGAIGADIRTRNVELNQAARDAAAVSPLTTTGGARDMTPGRISAEMQQDMHPVQGAIRQVAEATGGRVIRRSSELGKELSQIVEEGHAIYMLSFTPQGEADDRYHVLTVKLVGHHPGVSVRARSGYVFAREPATLRERFQQAVWRPVEASEVAVTATVAASGGGARVMLTIAAADLGMEQHGDRWMDRLDIFFIERDDQGVHARVEGQTMGLRLKPQTYQSLMAAGVPFERFVRLRPEAATLRVVVVDENTGRMGSVTIPAAALGAKP